jgi:hypothetical protein
MRLSVVDMRVAREEVGTPPFFHDLLHIGVREERALSSILGLNSGPWLSLAIEIYQAIAAAVLHYVHEQSPSRNVAHWIALSDYPEARRLLGIEDVTDHAIRSGVAQAFLREIGQGGNLGDAYCATLPADLRHRLGEHYTPDWLVTRMTEPIVGCGTITDPACGDGRFLSALVQLGHPVDKVCGVELNPLAVMIARYTVWVASGRPLDPPCSIEWSDFLLGDHYEGMGKIEDLPTPDIFVGNPPWVTWRTIPPLYRKHVAKRWSTSSINTLRGWNARVSAGQTDLCHLFLHETIERVALNGSVFFVLPRSTFKGPVGSAPIRSGISNSGRLYGYEEVWEVDASEAFTEVRSDTVVARLSVDAPQQFPVRWQQIRKDTQNAVVEHEARLMDEGDPNSSWVTHSDVRMLKLADGQRHAVLRARGGINTGGGNSVFHVRVLDQTPSEVTIENILSSKASVDVNVVRATVEGTFVRPLLRGREIKSWRAEPGDAVLVPHDHQDLRHVVPSGRLKAQAPKTWRYLCRFESHLRDRKELARWGGEWYSLFRIGPYTAGCWRVVWPHSSGQNLRAAILSPDDPTVPDQKVVLLAFDSDFEALFYCALLNSEPVRQLVRGTSGLDASPNIVRRIAMPEFDKRDSRHQVIVKYARASVADPKRADPGQLNDLAWALYV